MSLGTIFKSNALRLLGAASLVTIGAVSAGCVVTTSTGTSTGGVVVDWTINGVKDPSQCTATGSVYAQVDVIDASGAKVNANDTMDCTAMATTVTGVPSGYTYTVNVTLLASDHATARTTTVSVGGVYVYSGQNTSPVAVDFPASSFH
jgi:hypothetical protein